jgi:hypothetical protein
VIKQQSNSPTNLSSGTQVTGYLLGAGVIMALVSLLGAATTWGWMKKRKTGSKSQRLHPRQWNTFSEDSL